MRDRGRVVLGLAAVACAVVAIVVGIRYRALAERHEATEGRLGTFCAGVRMAMREDATELESGDRVRQRAAAARFLHGPIVFHGPQSVELCTERFPEAQTRCEIAEDFACLARTAREIAARIAD